MSSFYVLNVDLAGSSTLQLEPQDRARISRVLENFFRFLLENAGVPEESCLWAGDGGFALIRTDKHKASDVLRVAEWFGAHVETFFNYGYLQIENLPPPRLRISIGRIDASPPSHEDHGRRLSNMAGWALNLILKYERDFGREGHISIWDNVYKDLGSDAQRFSGRAEPVRGVIVYDEKISHNQTDTMSLMLASKQKIDKKSLEHAILELDRIRSGSSADDQFRKAVAEIFTPADLFQEVTFHIDAFLDRRFQGVSFRTAYARPDGNYLVIGAPSKKGPDDVYQKIPIDGRFTAALAFHERRRISVPSTIEEITKPASKRRFEKTRPKQDLTRLASIMCIPVLVKEDTKGVLCIDCPVDGFFSEAISEPVAGALDFLVTEIALAEVFDELLRICPEKQKPHPPSKRKNRKD